jgi:hypothetical protein
VAIQNAFCSSLEVIKVGPLVDGLSPGCDHKVDLL